MLPKKRLPTHPGEMLLKEFLEPMGITQKAFCEHLGWSYPRLNEIINKRRGVSADSALAFAEAFNIYLSDFKMRDPNAERVALESPLCDLLGA